MLKNLIFLVLTRVTSPVQDREGSISIQDLSNMTMIKPEDILSTLQHLGMIQYIKGQHVIYAAKDIVSMHLKKCGSAGLVVEPSKIIWTPPQAEQYK